MNPRFYFNRLTARLGLGLALLGLAAVQATAQKAQSYYLKDAGAAMEVLSVLAPPPLPDSPEQAADLAEVRVVTHGALPADLAVAVTEKKFNLYTFTPAIGGFFQTNRFPKTQTFLMRVQQGAAFIADTGKLLWRRPRPFVLDPSVASGALEKSFSYPSGHSTESMTLALVLAQLFPSCREAILAEARGIGWRRVELGRHYPTDIYAGRVLAQAIFHVFQQNPDFQKDLKEAQAEIAAFRF